MKKILIATRPDDSHAHFVKLALEKYGHLVDHWYTADFPSKTTCSFEIGTDKYKWQPLSMNNETLSGSYDVVWYRRPAKPILPDYIHPEDISNSKRENNFYFQSLWSVVYPEARWINPVYCAAMANSKLLQLKLADALKLKIPDTLISNDPAKIKAFINKHTDKVIYKTISPMAWLGKDEISLTYASNITLDCLPSDSIYNAHLAFFRNKLKKNMSFE